MSEAFVKVGMNLVVIIAVFSVGIPVGLVEGKLVEGAVRHFECRKVVGVGYVGNGHGL